MASKPEPPEDKIADELADKIKADEAMLRGLTYAYGQEMLNAQEHGGEYPAPEKLESINRLKLQLQSDRQYLEARELTLRKRA